MEEELLVGGFMNTVARVGDTVRRSSGEWTPTIHRLLSHARECGVTWVPEPLGYDELGREILSFTPGDIPHEMPEWVWSDIVLSDVARALRKWHDATSSFDASGAVWQLGSHEPHEVICHNDFAPYNCVFRNGRFVGAIDFDLCSPGPRLWDVAYAAYRYVPLMPPIDADVPDGAREYSPFNVADGYARLEAFLAAYAGDKLPVCYDPTDVFDTAIVRLNAIAAWTISHAAKTENSELESHAQMYQAHAQWLSAQLRGGLTQR